MSKFGPQKEIARHGAVVRHTTKPAMTVLRDPSLLWCGLRRGFRRQFRCDLRSRFENLAQAGYDIHNVLLRFLSVTTDREEWCRADVWMFALNGSFFACKDKAFNRISDFVATACWAGPD